MAAVVGPPAALLETLQALALEDTTALEIIASSNALSRSHVSALVAWCSSGKTAPFPDLPRNYKTQGVRFAALTKSLTCVGTDVYFQEVHVVQLQKAYRHASIAFFSMCRMTTQASRLAREGSPLGIVCPRTSKNWCRGKIGTQPWQRYSLKCTHALQSA
jgi:hypothetical protein